MDPEEIESTASYHSPEKLPEYLRCALQTNEPGGYRPYLIVLDEVIAQQHGLDRPVVRQAIDTYVERGLIERHTMKTRVYLKDLTASYAPRLTEEMYDCLVVVREYLSDNEFTSLPFAEIRLRINSPANLYYWVGVFTELGFLERKGNRSGKYRLGSKTQVAIYAENSYEEGRLVDFAQAQSKKGSSEMPSPSPEEVLSILNAALNGLEIRFRIEKRIEDLQATLKDAGADSVRIEELLRPLRFEYSHSVPNISEQELTQLKASLPLWQRHLTTERRDV